ncbi:MAG: hypothetical protein IH620_08080 [Ignavibacterium sp.]|nr:hypothetical protein [Ignavibacterium sp.]HCY75145.1 hypothetical protein [Ignavibacteriales bacterium]
MNKNKLLKWSLAVIFGFTTLTYIGCEQKNEKAEQPQNDKVTADNTTGNQEVPKDTVVTVKKIIIPDLKGKWSGVFDGRSSVLNITEQTDSNFSGKITTNYRQVMNQDIKGTLTPSKMEITMTDQLQSRSQGKYSAVLSSDLQMISGTFTLDRDGSKYTFNLKKK